ncbi:MAG: response regulator transcription factor [Lachnospiraceae bacterium]|nr:response regulator transcription factor [Lachnospiraceae bacterium]
MAYTILTADDEKEIRDVFRLYLEQAGYNVLEAENGMKALEILKKEKVDLVLLDVMMPGIDGYRTLKNIREANNIPVIMVSAKSAESDRILGLNMGADDYIVKPFQPMEAIARINANIRRFYSLGANAKKETLPELKVRNLRLNQESCLLYKGDEEIVLTSVEFKVLKLLMSNPGRVYTKQQLYEAGWDDDFYVADNNVMVCISKLRAKMSEDPNEYIRTVRGLGYRLQ